MSDSRDTGLVLDPKYDANGLLTAVVTDHLTGEVLMVAHMNAEALAATRTTGIAHFWSRSRASLWRKGETSGHQLRADAAGPACHTGQRSCFFRRIEGDALAPIA
jgi:phosphoribosyl-AMP cyclohydrolase